MAYFLNTASNIVHCRRSALRSVLRSDIRKAKGSGSAMTKLPRRGAAGRFSSPPNLRRSRWRAAPLPQRSTAGVEALRRCCQPQAARGDLCCPLAPSLAIRIVCSRGPESILQPAVHPVLSLLGAIPIAGRVFVHSDTSEPATVGVHAGAAVNVGDLSVLDSRAQVADAVPYPLRSAIRPAPGGR